MTKIKIDPTKFTLADIQATLSNTNTITRIINALRFQAKLETLDSIFKLTLDEILRYRNTGPKGILMLLTCLYNNFEFDIVKERDILFYTTVKILSKDKVELLAIQDIFLKIRGYKGGFDERQKLIMRKRLEIIKFKILEHYRIIENYKEERNNLQSLLKS